MPKRILSEITTTAAAESPKKRGRPCKKLEPLPKEIMKALNILNAYVEKQQAQVAACESESESAEPPKSPEVSEEASPKKKGGWPKGKKRGPKKASPSPEVSADKTDPLVLVPDDEDWNPRSLNQDKKVIALIRKYLATSSRLRDITAPSNVTFSVYEYEKLDNLIHDLASKLQEIGVFESKHCNREVWKLKRLSKLTAEQREKIDCGLMSEEDRAEHQRSQGRVYRGKYSLP